MDIPDTEVKYWDSDTVAILAALSLQNQNLNINHSIVSSKKYAELKNIEYDINHKKHEDETSKFNEIAKNITESIGLPNYSILTMLAKEERYQKKLFRNV